MWHGIVRVSRRAMVAGPSLRTTAGEAHGVVLSCQRSRGRTTSAHAWVPLSPNGVPPQGAPMGPVGGAEAVWAGAAAGTCIIGTAAGAGAAAAGFHTLRGWPRAPEAAGAGAARVMNGLEASVPAAGADAGANGSAMLPGASECPPVGWHGGGTKLALCQAKNVCVGIIYPGSGDQAGGDGLAAEKLGVRQYQAWGSRALREAGAVVMRARAVSWSCPPPAHASSALSGISCTGARVAQPLLCWKAKVSALADSQAVTRDESVTCRVRPRRRSRLP